MPLIPVDDQPDELVEQLVGRTLTLLETEYPNGIRLTLTEAPTTSITPRSIYPAFYGCYDWHSAVHSHWQVVRGLRLYPNGEFGAEATAVLDRTLTPTNVATEMEWIEARPTFEMPYGMAWLLRLCRELCDWDDERAERWWGALAPMETHAHEQFARYCATLTVPVRGGMHHQTAFSLALVLDSLADPGDEVTASVRAASERLYRADTDVDLRFEPSAADFLSPSLAEADLMRRVLTPTEFAVWLDRFAPHGFDGLQPVTVVDPTHGQLAHWAGLNLSRSWMMSSVADALPIGHRWVDSLRINADAHAAAGLATASHEAYAISHWVPTFAVYLLTAGAT